MHGSLKNKENTLDREHNLGQSRVVCHFISSRKQIATHTCSRRNSLLFSHGTFSQPQLWNRGYRMSVIQTPAAPSFKSDATAKVVKVTPPRARTYRLFMGLTRTATRTDAIAHPAQHRPLCLFRRREGDS